MDQAVSVAKWYIYNAIPTPKAQGKITEEAIEIVEEPKDQDICCYVVLSVCAREAAPVKD